MKGYKVFNEDWTCREKQYTCPGTFSEDVELSMCGQGMHFCKNLIDCFRYYDFDPRNKVAEVEATGEIIVGEDKCVTNKIKIIRELTWSEVLEKVNTGKYCTGNRNSGDFNSGNRNSGDFNSGYCNSGNCNSGYFNSGDFNSGYRNSGDFNSGYRNSGDYNSGDRNSGDFNQCSYSNGCFNTVSPKIMLFNKISDWTYEDWMKSDAYRILGQMPMDVLSYVTWNQMTEEEKREHPKAETTGGYLKQEETANRQAWWDSISRRDKESIVSIPNFDRDIFLQITGFDACKESENRTKDCKK